jgi:hypothetical protein
MVIDQVALQLREGYLNFDRLTGLADAEQWFSQNRSLLKDSVAFQFEVLLRTTVTELNNLGDFVRAALASPPNQRPSDKDFQRRVESVWSLFLNEARKVLAAMDEKTSQHFHINNSTVGAIQPGSGNTAHVQQSVQVTLPVDLTVLASELAELRNALVARATEPDHFHSVAEVASAANAAQKKDETAVAKHLKAAGKWALEIAGKVGASVAEKAITASLDLP